MPENPYQAPRAEGTPVEMRPWQRVARIAVILLVVFVLNVACALLVFAIGVKLMFFSAP